MTIADIPMLPITLGNEQVVRPHYEEARKHAQERGVTRTLRTIARLRQHDPLLANLIDEIGMPSKVWLDRSVRLMLENDAHDRAAVREQGGSEREPLTEEFARTIAKADHERTMRDYFSASPEVARQMYYDASEFPATLDTLKLGRGVVIACADYDALERVYGANAGTLVRNENSELWMTATAAEVAEWLTRFCEAWK